MATASLCYIAAVAPDVGLRARKKQRTRQLIAETARRLFCERGFDAVTVAEVARAADVSEGTVFNYFPAKEDLVYRGLESFEDDLLKAVREREPGESVLQAFKRFVLEQRGLLAQQDPEARERLTELTRMITGSPALLAREREIFERYTAALAALLAEETGARPGDVEPWVVANALMGVHRARLADARARILAGVPSARIMRELRARAERAFGRLEAGLGGYAVKPGRSKP
jgi:AcrR family transcriptional regulator